MARLRDPQTSRAIANLVRRTFCSPISSPPLLLLPPAVDVRSPPSFSFARSLVRSFVRSLALVGASRAQAARFRPTNEQANIWRGEAAQCCSAPLGLDAQKFADGGRQFAAEAHLQQASPRAPQQRLSKLVRRRGLFENADWANRRRCATALSRHRRRHPPHSAPTNEPL